MTSFARLGETRQTMPMARLGPPCSMPRFRWQQPLVFQGSSSPVGLTEEETQSGFDWGRDSILPYQVQDSYDRTLNDSELDVVTLENERFFLKVAPSLGGRLLALRDKSEDRDLVFENPVFQPANLAALNAWFSGGIEWNGLTPGHSPSTCSSVFCDQADTDQGPVLRLYEFDRIAEAVWQISLFLPPGDGSLTIHGSLVNPNPNPALVYWWTNIAAPASSGIRIVSEADYSIEHVLPDNHLERFDFPCRNGRDGSFPHAWGGSTSVFFRSVRRDFPFIAALDAQGQGIVHMAGDALVGRKFFYFGTLPGGRHWMDFLSRPGEGEYVEIQAGLMPTQNQRHVLPAYARTHWTAVAMPIKIAPEEAQHPDYRCAVHAVQAALAVQMPPERHAALDRFLQAVSLRPATRQLSCGSPWGRRHQAMIGRPLAEGMDFSSPDPDDFWDYVARSAPLPEGWNRSLPQGFAVSPLWTEALKASAKRVSAAEDWLHPLFLSIGALDRNERDEAKRQAALSLERRPSWLAWRQKALLAETAAEAVQAYREAWDTGAAPLSLAVEIADYIDRHGDAQELGVFLRNLGEVAQTHERLVLALARDAARRGDAAALEKHLDRDFAGIREGETITTDLWSELQRLTLQKTLGRSPDFAALKRFLQDNPPPLRLDFRMAASSVDETSDADVLGAETGWKRRD